MKKINLTIISIFLLINNFVFSNLQSQIDNIIIVKVGETIITSVDVQNEIITNLILNKQEITQESIDLNKGYAIKNLVNKSLKKSEIDKYQIKDYNKLDLENFTKKTAKNLNTDLKGLKKIFKQSNINYKAYVEKYETELLWNTLIFKLYKNQLNINIVDVERQVEKIKDTEDKEELKKIKENILLKEKNDKLNLLSRSHFSNLENTIVIEFK
jgi:hypothetical protein